MKVKIIFLFFIVASLLITACGEATPTAVPTEVSQPEPTSTTAVDLPEPTPEVSESPTSAQAAAAGVELVCSLGDQFDDCGQGTEVIVGAVSSGNIVVTPELFPNPTAVLIDTSYQLQKQYQFISESGQLIGYFFQPMFPGPGKVQINLPLVPGGASIDLDNNGKEDVGVKIFSLRVSFNMIGGPYLDQLEQNSGLSSYIPDPLTGDVLMGTFLVYAADDEQGFPASAGEDGVWFTEDDPAITLPRGYSVATLSDEGKVTLDRSPEVAMNTIEREERKSPDFSDQSILQSYNSLIDLLIKRYAFTELRNLNWEEIRAEYLPEVEKADAEQDYSAYYLALKALAQSIKDGHVAATTTNGELENAFTLSVVSQIGGSLGASTLAVLDEETPITSIGTKIVLLTVAEGTPASEAGWVPGTEIVSINGEPASARLEQVPLLKSYGTETSRVSAQAESILKFPEGEEVTIGYILPGTTEVMEATMVAGDYADGKTALPSEYSLPIDITMVNNYVVVHWSNFMEFLLAKINVLEEALEIAKNQGAKGMILDLRGNTGGLSTLYMTMASYFFTAEEPMPTNVFDWYFYDEQSGGHVKNYSEDSRLSAPRPELAYTGPLVALVDKGCASSCEYFTQHLQTLKRATVIGQYPSNGAGGSIDRVTMPGQITFQFTQGESTFAGTDEPNLEAKGVVPDIFVPVTVETELAKMNGEDPVMNAAFAFLDEASDKLVGSTWLWSGTLDAAVNITPIENSANYTITFDKDGAVAIQADCNQVTGSYTRDEYGAMTITIGPSTLMACPAESQGEAFLEYLAKVTSFTYEGDQLVLVVNPEAGIVGMLFDPAQ